MTEWLVLTLILCNATGAVCLAYGARYCDHSVWADRVGRLGGALLWLSLFLLAVEAWPKQVP